MHSTEILKTLLVALVTSNMVSAIPVPQDPDGALSNFKVFFSDRLAEELFGTAEDATKDATKDASKIVKARDELDNSQQNVLNLPLSVFRSLLKAADGTTKDADKVVKARDASAKQQDGTLGTILQFQSDFFPVSKPVYFSVS